LRHWQERFTVCTFTWSIGNRAWGDARRLAWSDLQNEWHDLHGRRWPAWQCAGCEQPIGGREAIGLPDGNRVHFEPVSFLVNFGRRWRGDADAALVVAGLKPPADG
jgi:hypothetical protein